MKVVDCKIFCSKQLFLAEMQKIFDEMYSLNYDAFIDSVRGYETPLNIEVKNIDCFENAQDLAEVLQIVQKENPLITITIS